MWWRGRKKGTPRDLWRGEKNMDEPLNSTALNYDPRKSIRYPSPFFLFHLPPHVSFLSYTCVYEDGDMRLFSFLPVLGLFLGTRASSQALHRFDLRDLVDVCASINSELVVPDLLGVLTAVGVISESNFPIITYLRAKSFLCS